jgi:hypothetical protein
LVHLLVGIQPSDEHADPLTADAPGAVQKDLSTVVVPETWIVGQDADEVRVLARVGEEGGGGGMSKVSHP